jgi:pilus assembly protein Flp/PilA
MLTILKKRMLPIFKQEKGQGMVEYALLIGLIAIVVIAVLVFLGPAIADKFQEIIDALKGTPAA